MAKVNLGFDAMRVEIRQKNNPAGKPAGRVLVAGLGRPAERDGPEITSSSS
jgi:hypothetical protein